MTKPKIYLFIDTNIFLSFYAYTNDDVEELRKLSSLIKTGQLKLFLTEQVKDEFYRNREEKLKESIKEFGKSTATDSIPRFMETYASIRNYRQSLQGLLKAKDEAITQAKKEAEGRSIAADTLFRELVDAAGERRIREINERLGVLSPTEISRGSLPTEIGAEEVNALYEERDRLAKQLQEET